MIGRFSHPRLQPPRSGIRSRRRRDDRRTGVRSGCRSPGGRYRRCSSSRRRRVASDWARSVSGSANHCGSAHCTGWCARSPVISAWSPPDSRWTATCPGVWPGVSSRRISSVTRWSGGDEVGEPGVDHRSDRVVERHRVAHVAASRSTSAPIRHDRAGSGRSGTSGPTSRRPASCSTPRGRSAGGCRSRCRPLRAGSPAAARSSRNGVCRLSASMPGMRRSFPMQVSTMMRRSPAVTPKAWIDSTRLPSSSTKCGSEPRRMRRDHLGGRVGQQPGGRDVRHALDHPGDGEVAHLPLQVVAHAGSPVAGRQSPSRSVGH